MDICHKDTKNRENLDKLYKKNEQALPNPSPRVRKA